MEKSIFSYDSYRPYLQDKLTAEGRRGQLSRAAESLGCQTSFLSRVINEELHLTPEHAFKLARFWSLLGDEQSYFLKLVDYERAGDPEFQKFIKSQIDELKKKNSEISKRTSRENKTFEGLSLKYFGSWIYGAIHFLTCIPKYQTLQSLAKRLSLPEDLVLETLKDLETMNFVKQNKGLWLYQQGDFHIERTSPFVILHHQNWRQRAILDAQNFSSQSIHYTIVLTLSHKDIERIRALVLEYIAEISRIASPSIPEEEVVFNCDFFKV